MDGRRCLAEEQVTAFMCLILSACTKGHKTRCLQSAARAAHRQNLHDSLCRSRECAAVEKLAGLAFCEP